MTTNIDCTSPQFFGNAISAGANWLARPPSGPWLTLRISLELEHHCHASRIQKPNIHTELEMRTRTTTRQTICVMSQHVQGQLGMPRFAVPCIRGGVRVPLHTLGYHHAPYVTVLWVCSSKYPSTFGGWRTIIALARLLPERDDEVLAVQIPVHLCKSMSAPSAPIVIGLLGCWSIDARLRPNTQQPVAPSSEFQWGRNSKYVLLGSKHTKYQFIMHRQCFAFIQQ